jgi:hypothetical protein
VHNKPAQHLQQRRLKVVAVRAAEVRKAAVAGAEAALRCTPLQPVRRT